TLGATDCVGAASTGDTMAGAISGLVIGLMSSSTCSTIDPAASTGSRLVATVSSTAGAGRRSATYSSMGGLVVRRVGASTCSTIGAASPATSSTTGGAVFRSSTTS